MRRFVLGLLILLVVLAGLGFLALGAFPPAPRPQAVERVLPNDSFKPQG
ncbi:MAG: hypothetical protein KGJ41_07880 [Rhodospirillales bacterium]|nr:hypothetical protein [Rhodospirillales bacterium]MDE2198927.1 hypothetical protein [Rhodospirillales bacterium]MDE2574113.1 hypothetical protein [Rhodospirillales bacterium]